MIVRAIALILAFSLAGVSSGYACSRAPGTPEPTQEELFSQASAVFIAHLTQVEEIRPDDPAKGMPGTISGTFRAIEILKGSPPANNKIRSWAYGYGNCTIPMLAGADYIFFMRSDDEEITFITGSVGPILNLKGSQVQTLLDGLRALKK